MIRKRLRKIIEQLLLVFFILKKKEILPSYILKHRLTHEKEISLLIIRNEEKEGWYYNEVS